MDLDNMRQNGVRSLLIYCNNQACLHRATMNVDAYPGHLLVKSFEGKLICSQCGSKDVDARPNWNDRPTHVPNLTISTRKKY